ncbi:hypothetical protein F8M41_001730 [Gigaspora margarita]|uniref:Uncharacterized protein n=1 Tax=Gigaspora margarita TaxID=4874 RepID=A0A8H4AYY2_GIGMA|nr:hypothetical protein F8M41_001730 [Gigaspora margarita]
MSSYQYYISSHTYPSRNSLSKHMSKCLSTVKNVLVIAKCAESFHKFSLFNKLPQDNHFDINEDQLDIGYSSKTSKKILFKDINFNNPVQNINLEIDPNTNILDEFKNTLQGYRELFDDMLVSADYFEDMLSDDENQEYDEFSNEAYMI